MFSYLAVRVSQVGWKRHARDVNPKLRKINDRRISICMMPVPIKQAVYRMCGLQNYFVATAVYQVLKGCEGTYEEFLLKLPQGGLLLDIGANLGVTVAFARRERPDLKVIAFEPISANVAAARNLWRILGVNGAELKPIALGDSAGTVEMVMPILRGLPAPGQTYVKSGEWDYSSVLGNSGIQFTAPVATIDSLQLPMYMASSWMSRILSGMFFPVRVSFSKEIICAYTASFGTLRTEAKLSNCCGSAVTAAKSLPRRKIFCFLRLTAPASKTEIRNRMSSLFSHCIRGEAVCAEQDFGTLRGRGEGIVGVQVEVQLFTRTLQTKKGSRHREPFLLNLSIPIGLRGVYFLMDPYWTFVTHARSDLSPLESGGDDETRTRDLCRDSPAMLVFSTTYKPVGDA